MTQSFRGLLESEGPLILPGVYDALSARLARQAGFAAYFIGGFPAVGARYGVPDVGLKSLGEISAAVRDIVAASDLPVLVDGDDGYGDVKNVVHTLHTYERMGVASIMFEDQRWPKRCGHMAGKTIVPAEQMEAKVRAAAGERLNAQTFVWARTGADGLFVEAPRSIEELERIGRAFDVPLQANPLAGGLTPILRPEQLYAMGFKVIVYGIDLLMHVTKTMKLALEDIRSGTFAMQGKGATFQEYLAAVGFDDWSGVETRYGQ
jgi:2-methylisocitrate lyase-like PEP mutase family enzyme